MTCFIIIKRICVRYTKYRQSRLNFFSSLWR